MKTGMMTVMAMVFVMGAQYCEATDQPPPIPSEEQPQVLTRGPVNEAFAEPVNLTNQTGLVAPTAPPARIDEVPPADRPVGDQFVWVPGYWAWDSDRSGYIWVSGCWRAAPPDMNWVPGYWAKAAGGWQWVAGFWTPVSNQEIEYLPAPPELTNVEPPGAAPPDRIWVPPCWYWSHGQYIRRPGYWIDAQADWVWSPAHYVWTPRGYVFVSGHWDYSLRRRGVLFAPVYFPGNIYARPGFSYPLSIVVDISDMELGLFTCPRYSHYYFGDYYDSVYIGVGIFPRFECERRHTWYDPIYMHDRWHHHRDDPQWGEHERREYDRRRADKSLRPPRTYHEMKDRVSRMPESQRRNFEIAEPMARVVTTKTTTYRFERIKSEDQHQMSRYSNDVHKFADERNHWESQGAGHNAGQPGLQRVPSPGPKDMTSPMERKGPAMNPYQHMESQSSERVHGNETSQRGHEGSTGFLDQQRSTKVAPYRDEWNQPDRVKVRTSPVVGKPSGGFWHKGPPSRPDEEKDDLRRR